MAWKGVAARVGLIATVSAIIVVGTLSPLLKQPLPSNDTGALVASAPLMAIPGGDAEVPATIPAAVRNSTLRSSPASTVGAADAPVPDAPPLALPSVRSPPPSITTQRPPDESAPAATQPGAEAQALPIAPVAEPPRAERRAKRRHSKRIVYNKQMMGNWAYHRMPVARPGSTPFSYDRQLAPW